MSETLFIRFATNRLDDYTCQPMGVFAVAYQLLDSATLADYEYTEILTTLDWFERHLPVPGRFARSRKPHREDKGVCWFKTSATDCMHNVRYLVQLVSEHGIMVRELTTRNPGYVIHEDDYQVTAEPFVNTPR